MIVRLQLLRLPYHPQISGLNRKCSIQARCQKTVISDSLAALPMRVIEVGMEQCQNEGAGEMGDPRENPLTSSIFWHDSQIQKSGSDPAGD
ncbi:hypothetical protein PR048_018319 [Dryococelus australis]|uniref:Uncharacterized protein n=1 Tax=Dryococelus australis TaxID=614101 RepID=A0ABQ9HBZ3_9NEOP|nr:hypothetical protein PR048_018319 [Dryococelus australis]